VNATCTSRERGVDVLLELLRRHQWQLALRPERRQDVVLDRLGIGLDRARLTRVALVEVLLGELRELLLPRLERRLRQRIVVERAEEDGLGLLGGGRCVDEQRSFHGSVSRSVSD
jgi:hypothetical protein